MRIDTHVHAALAKGIPFRLDWFQETLAAARGANLDALALTDHADTVGLTEMWAILDRHYAYDGLFYHCDGVLALPGLEVSVTEGPHLVALGDREAIAALYQRLECAPGREHPPAHAFFRASDDLNLYRVCAHPMRPKREIARLATSLVPLFDAFEVNARDIITNGPDVICQVRALAREQGAALVAGSDTHHPHQLGSIKMTVEPFSSITVLREVLSRGEPTLSIAPDLTQRVARAREAKRALKEALLGA